MRSCLRKGARTLAVFHHSSAPSRCAPVRSVMSEAPIDPEKEARKLEKKQKKEEEKAAKEAKKAAAAAAKSAPKAQAVVPSLTLLTFDDSPYGNLFIQSHKKTDREWNDVADLQPSMKDQKVWIRARVHKSRAQGGKLCFLELRGSLSTTVQAVVFGKDISGFANLLGRESVVDVFGTVSIPEAEIKSCTQSGVELQVERLYCISGAEPLPLQVEDAGRSEAELEADPSLVRVNQEVRLDNRILDLRTRANQGIFRIQSNVCRLFREYLIQNSFTEIHSPKLIATASEGGANVFKLGYFDTVAYMAQSPQLYKQMALQGDMERVFEVGPVFRAENSNTHRHLTEFTGLDMEMVFYEHYHEVLDMIDGMFNHIFTGLVRDCQPEIEAVRQQYPFPDLQWKHPCKRFTFIEAVNLLKKDGPGIVRERMAALQKDAETNPKSAHAIKVMEAHIQSISSKNVEEDLSTEDERVLGEVVHRAIGEDYYIIDKFPRAVRPFYTMPDPDNKTWSNSYDIFIRGEEIVSGAQRIHDPELLLENAEDLGVDLGPVQGYVDSFKYGAMPHAGCGVGMERVVMLFLQLNNIRKTSMFPRDPKRLSP
mmetsp:Transcript_34343/g.75084  ORF Transcript_34343/g.75084 Transcript_34343/m.75084 type:complete len:595 (-) Transcript_34343:254-2038(-)